MAHRNTGTNHILHDENDTTAGWGAPNATSWDDTSSLYWSTSTLGTASTNLWSNNPLDTMSFGSAVTAWNFAATQNINLTGTINAAGLDTWLASATTFNQPFRLQGGTINAGATNFLIRNQVGGGPNANTQNLRIDSVIQGSGGLTLDTTVGTRNVNAETRLAGNNTYTGVSTVRRSTLAIYNDNSLGASGAGNDTLIEQGGRVLFAGLNAGPTPLNVNESFRVRIQDAANPDAVAIRSANADNVLNGNVDFITGNGGGNDIAISVNTNNTFTINGNITGVQVGTANTPRIMLSTSGGAASQIIVNGDIGEANGATTAILINGSASGPNTGTVVFSGNNTYTGQTVIRRGILLLDSATALNGSSAIIMGDGGLTDSTNTLRLLTNGAYTVTQNISINNASGANTYTAVIGGNSAHTSTFTGQITINDTNSGTYQLTAAAGGQVNFTGLITDGTNTKTIQKTGAGVVNLSRAAGNTYDGGTIVTAGTLLVNNTTGSATGTGTVTVNSGATLGGEGFISGATSVSGSVSPGNSGIGTLSVANNVT